jgi:hypothetical protein
MDGYMLNVSKTRWDHKKSDCHMTLNLTAPIKGVPYGAKGNETHPIQNTYSSLAHMYMDWYMPYFQEKEYERLMIRFEDLVYRPKEVITKVCECVGGTIKGFKGKFLYKTKTSNKGPGHGQRSDLLSAFAKYGQPLSQFYARYDRKDRDIVKQVFFDTPGEEKGILQTFKYKLFD